MTNAEIINAVDAMLDKLLDHPITTESVAAFESARSDLLAGQGMTIEKFWEIATGTSGVDLRRAVEATIAYELCRC